MQITVDKSRNIEGGEGLVAHINTVVEEALNAMRDHITSIEVHISDESGPKGANKGKLDDMRCLMQAHLKHHQPVSTTCHDANLHDAIHGAAQKLLRLIESTLGRIRDRNPHTDPLLADDGDKADLE
jgi:ribosome-associated translation inhibitor RaiA